MAQEIELQERMDKLEKYVRNMRIAVIFIVAFFVYDALTESGFLGTGGPITTSETLRTHELLVIDKHSAGMLRIGSGANQSLELTIDNEAGQRLKLQADSIDASEKPGQAERRSRLHIDKQSIDFYTQQGEHSYRLSP